MNSDFDHQFKIFKNIALTINAEWQLYKELRTPENVDLFFHAGRGFYHLIEEAVLKSIVVGLGGLFDPEGTGKWSNLSAIRIMNLPEVSSIRRDLECILSPLLAQWEAGAGKWRNKLLAHCDLKVLTGQVDYPDFVMRDIEELTDGLWQFIRKINGQLYSSDISKSVLLPEGLPHITRFLRLGLAAQKAGKAHELLKS